MMNQKISNIDYEWLISPTGDPFADVGGYVIKFLSEKFPEKDISDLIEYIAKVYVNRWTAKIHAFYLNSTITQPSFIGERKVEETKKYFSSLINETEKSEFGFCRITGRKTYLFKAGRDNSIMSGSGTFVNFHHFFQQGIMLSKEAIIRMFFVPFGAISVGGKIAIVQSNDNSVNEFFVKHNCELNLSNIATNASEEILKSDFGIPANALFRFVDELFVNKLKEISDNPENLSITLYHFTNFGASPEITLYILPSKVFRFYSTCQTPKLKSDWQPFLLAHYSNSKMKGAIYNEKTNNYDISKKGETLQLTFDDYKIWRNALLDNLLKNKSILRSFVIWGRNHKFDFRIIELYQKNIKNMKKETLDKIKELAVFLTADVNEDSIKKTIKSLDGYKSAYELRRFFLKNVVTKNYIRGAEKSIITVDELVYYLFPDDVSWRDIRDILLFAIYQELHAKNIKVDAELTDEAADENELNN